MLSVALFIFQIFFENSDKSIAGFLFAAIYLKLSLLPIYAVEDLPLAVFAVMQIKAAIVRLDVAYIDTVLVDPERFDLLIKLIYIHFSFSPNDFMLAYITFLRFGRIVLKTGLVL